jgi:hypothetical protein
MHTFLKAEVFGNVITWQIMYDIMLKKKSIFKPVNTTWTFFSKKETKKDSKASN